MQTLSVILFIIPRKLWPIYLSVFLLPHFSLLLPWRYIDIQKDIDRYRYRQIFTPYFFLVDLKCSCRYRVRFTGRMGKLSFSLGETLQPPGQDKDEICQLVIYNVLLKFYMEAFYTTLSTLFREEWVVDLHVM